MVTGENDNKINGQKYVETHDICHLRESPLKILITKTEILSVQRRTCQPHPCDQSNHSIILRWRQVAPDMRPLGGMTSAVFTSGTTDLDPIMRIHQTYPRWRSFYDVTPSPRSVLVMRKAELGWHQDGRPRRRRADRGPCGPGPGTRKHRGDRATVE